MPEENVLVSCACVLRAAGGASGKTSFVRLWLQRKPLLGSRRCSRSMLLPLRHLRAPVPHPHNKSHLFSLVFFASSLFELCKNKADLIANTVMSGKWSVFCESVSSRELSRLFTLRGCAVAMHKNHVRPCHVTIDKIPNTYLMDVAQSHRLY